MQLEPSQKEYIDFQITGAPEIILLVILSNLFFLLSFWKVSHYLHILAIASSSLSLPPPFGLIIYGIQ